MSDKNKNTRPGQSSGPRSSRGKENSSRNAATHGLSCKKFFLIPSEKEEDFLAHAQRWFDAYKDQASPALELLLQDLAEAHWLYKRASLRIFESESAFAMAETNRDGSADEVFKRLRNMQRYKTSYENSFHKALRAVEAFCKNRIAAQFAEGQAEHKEASTVVLKLKSLQLLVKSCSLDANEARAALKHLFSPDGPNPGSPTVPQTDPLQ